MSHLSGFAEVDLINYTSGVSSLVAGPSQDVSVRTLGTGPSQVTASSGHVVVEVAGNGYSNIYGSTGQLDVKVDTGGNAQVQAGSGAVSVQSGGNLSVVNVGSGSLTASVDANAGLKYGT